MIIFDPVFAILALIVDIYFKIVVVQIVLHWLLHFKVLEVSNKYAQKTVELLEKATSPVYNFIKSKVKTEYANIDFAPFALLIAIYFVSRIIISIRMFIAG